MLRFFLKKLKIYHWTKVKSIFFSYETEFVWQNLFSVQKNQMPHLKIRAPSK